jgi:hypothetical protein
MRRMAAHISEHQHATEAESLLKKAGQTQLRGQTIRQMVMAQEKLNRKQSVKIGK